MKKRQHYRHLPAFILLVLAGGEAHGGAIHSTLVSTLPQFGADTGAVYRALQQLEQEGSVVSAWDTTESGPARKKYRITTSGWERLDEWKQEIETRVANLEHFLSTYKQTIQQKSRK